MFDRPLSPGDVSIYAGDTVSAPLIDPVDLRLSDVEDLAPLGVQSLQPVDNGSHGLPIGDRGRAPIRHRLGPIVAFDELVEVAF